MSAIAESVLAALTARYLEAQLTGDRQRAVQLLIDDGVKAGVPVDDLLLHVITPAQREIGRLWEANEVSVADEHVATAISQLAMSYLYSHAPPSGLRREHILIACVDGEWHDMGARIAADVLEHHGFSVCLLGPSVPTDDLIARVRQESPDIVLLSITMPTHVASLRSTFEALTRAYPLLPVLVGGRGTVDDPSLSFPLPALPADRATVCVEVERLLQA
jgi:MerR family transcriptional regulator, light-induced transcriptional regulator